jgi:uncharacterized protein (DUF488 family)
MPSELTIYTIGHSDRDPQSFEDLLRRHAIDLVVDVRSQPYSRWVPQFNRETLMRHLKDSGFAYLFLGDSLGGRPADPTLYDAEDEGHPSYKLVERTQAYRDGIDQLLELASIQTVAVMCSEGDYRRCHRHHLITPTLLKRGMNVVHIQPDGTTVTASLPPEQLTLFG